MHLPWKIWDKYSPLLRYLVHEVLVHKAVLRISMEEDNDRDRGVCILV